VGAPLAASTRHPATPLRGLVHCAVGLHLHSLFERLFSLQCSAVLLPVYDTHLSLSLLCPVTSLAQTGLAPVASHRGLHHLV
jgi:hypothetical protein